MTDLLGIRCPRCGSEDFRALSLLHSQGRSQSIGFIHGGATHGNAVGVGTSQTDLSKQVAPPREYGLALPLFCGFLIFLGVMVFAEMAFTAEPTLSDWMVKAAPVVGIITAVAIYLPRRKWNRTEFPKLMTEWRTSFLCMRCATRFRSVPQRLAVSAVPLQDIRAPERETTRRFR